LNKYIQFSIPKLFSSKQTFFIKNFSKHYDILIGRQILKESSAKIDFMKNTIELHNYEFPMVNITEKCNQTASNVVDDEEYNYALQTDLSDNNIRDDHLNNEEKTELQFNVKIF